MADNIIKLKVDSQEYEGKIKRASQGLQELGRSLREAGKTFADADAKQVEFARELGKMQTVSNTAKGKIAEMSAAFINLKSQYLQMTDAEKQSPIGQAMSKSLEQLKARTISAKNELESLNRELNATGAKATGGGGLKQMLGGVAGQLGVSTSMFTGVGAAVAAYKAISGNVSTAMGFEKSMSQLSSLTGKVGKDLEQLKEYAIELGSTSTLTASEVADAFRMIGSQQPQLLESGEALKNVTKYAITLSEAAGIDLATAAQTLSTSINQMGGDSNNAARYINVLAAASQKGAGDIAWLGEAVTKSGTTAKAVGTDYEELVANLEQLAKAGFDASTAGTALRSIIMNLEKQANNDFKPSIVGLTQAFENLGKANLSIVGYQEIAGKMFASQAKALADAAGEAKNMTAAITGTNTAEEQAKTNTDNLDGSLKSLASAWEGLNLHINSSNGFLRDCVDWLKEVVVWADQTFTAAGRAQKALAQLNGSNNGGQSKVDRMLGNLRNAGSGNRQSIFQQQQAEIWRYINSRENYMKDRQRWVNGGGQNEDLRQSLIAQAKSFGTSNVNDIKAQIDAAKKTLADYQQAAKQTLNPVKADIDTKGLGGSTSTKKGTVGAPEGSIEAQTKKVQDLQKAWRAAADDTSREEIKKQIDEAQFALDKMLGKVKDRPKMEAVDMNAITPNGGIGSLIQDTFTRQKNGLAVLKQQIKLEIDQEALKADTETLKAILKDSIQNGIDGMYFQMMGIGGEIAKGINVPDEAWQSILDQYNTLREQIGLEPIKINFDTGGLEKVDNDVDGLKKTISTTAKVVGTIGQAFNAIEDPAAKVSATVAMAIANIAMAYSDALAKDTTQKFNIVGFIASTAAAMISMGTTIAQIKSATGYAQGGILKGNSYSGDNIMGVNNSTGELVGLNAGEVVLNRAQTAGLAQELEGAGGSRQVVVRGVLHGKDLFIAAENWAKSVGKGEFVTW